MQYVSEKGFFLLHFVGPGLGAPIRKKRRNNSIINRTYRFNLVLILISLLNISICVAAGQDGKRQGFVVLPFVIYSPETEAAVTLTGVYHYRDAGESQVPPSMVILSMAYSKLDQKRVGLTPELYLSRVLWLIRGEFAYEDWPNKFWGIGSDSEESAEEDYSSRNILGAINFQRRLGSAWWVGLLYDYADYDLTEREPGGLLDSGLFLGSNGGQASGIGIFATHDTRDDINYPHTGGLLEVSATRYDSRLGSDFNFSRYVLDARVFVSLGVQHVLALQGYSKITNGEVPFQQLARIGVASDLSMMRGYHDGRFLDKDSVLTQAEYRFPISGRWGSAVFGGLGEVVPVLGDLIILDLKWTAGAGLRFRASQQEAINLRLDVGVGEEGAALYFNIFEAF
jgi:hypothetical protein